jgi:hypothetical protein
MDEHGKCGRTTKTGQGQMQTDGVVWSLQQAVTIMGTKVEK